MNFIQGRMYPTLNRAVLFLSVASALTACTSWQKAPSTAATCEQLQELVADHSSGFQNFRGRASDAKSITVWRSNFHLVGNDCQVWGWGEGRFSYVCSLIEPNEATAQTHFKAAQEKARTCLDSSWSITVGERAMGPGKRADFSHPDKTAVISMVVMPSPALFRDEWRTYYFVGDVKELK